MKENTSKLVGIVGNIIFIIGVIQLIFYNKYQILSRGFTLLFLFSGLVMMMLGLRDMKHKNKETQEYIRKTMNTSFKFYAIAFAILIGGVLILIPLTSIVLFPLFGESSAIISFFIWIALWVFYSLLFTMC